MVDIVDEHGNVLKKGDEPQKGGNGQDHKEAEEVKPIPIVNVVFIKGDRDLGIGFNFPEIGKNQISETQIYGALEQIKFIIRAEFNKARIAAHNQQGLINKMKHRLFTSDKMRKH